MVETFSDKEIQTIQSCIIHKDFNTAAFHILNKKMLQTFSVEERQEKIETLAGLLEETSPYWPDLEEDIVRIIAEKFLE